MSHVQHYMLTCDEVTELVTSYMEKRLSLWEAIRFQFHLGLCGDCRTYLEQMEETRDSLGKIDLAPMPEAVRAQMMERFRHWKRANVPAPESTESR